MRDIKFRALHEGVWYYQTLEEMLTITLAAFRMGEHKTQFTGLLDKNGKEIYEGDCDNDYSVVTWCDKRNGWALSIYDFHAKEFILCNCYDCEGHFDIKDDIDKFEVVGNIYEHKLDKSAEFCDYCGYALPNHEDRCTHT